MRRVILSVLLLAAPISSAAQQGENTLRITLEQAVARALTASPRVTAAESEILAHQGSWAEVTWPFPTNPTIEFERTRRRAVGSEVYDVGWRFSQQIELGGQFLRRRTAADLRIRAAEAYVGDAARVTSLETRLAYARLHLSERRNVLATSNAELAEQLADLAKRQLDAGEINVLAFNTAALEAARARSLAERMGGDRRAAAADLGRLLALGDQSISTEPLPQLPHLLLVEGSLLTSAMRRRPDLEAADLEVDAASDLVSANRRRVVPDLELAVFDGEEEGTDDLLGFSLGLSVPLFQRAQAAVGSARAGRAAAQALSDATARSIRAEVEAWTERYLAAYAAERRFAGDLLLAGSENVALATLAFQEGELSIADVVVFRATALATQLEYLDVLADAYEAWFGLAATVDAEPQELINLGGTR